MRLELGGYLIAWIYLVASSLTTLTCLKKFTEKLQEIEEKVISVRTIVGYDSARTRTFNGTNYENIEKG